MAYNTVRGGKTRRFTALDQDVRSLGKRVATIQSNANPVNPTRHRHARHAAAILRVGDRKRRQEKLYSRAIQCLRHILEHGVGHRAAKAIVAPAARLKIAFKLRFRLLGAVTMSAQRERESDG